MQILGGGVNPYIQHAYANIRCFSIIKVNTKHYRYVVRLIHNDSKIHAIDQFWFAEALLPVRRRARRLFPPIPTVFKHSAQLGPSRRKSRGCHRSHDGQSPQRIHEPPIRSKFDSENLSSSLHSTVPAAVRFGRIPPPASIKAGPPFPFLQPSATPDSFSAGRR